VGDRPAIGALYVVAGSNLYKNGVLLSALTVPTAQFKFQQIRGVTPMLVLGDGKNAYYTDGTTVTNINTHDADFQRRSCLGGLTWMERSM